ncbi:2-C-methyl-D-erythritol 4-phosphate cytidylyltransferase [Fodinicurvata sp. EGI_FJ10296]|uniref:2-C-methyl-D-erythritol 4-phosphate cytidylyltransferase n=1 Tax=Fodinicurvata sp. EGI_FJ10296 TaxID=3231908 RepID=UPI003451EB5A
MSNVAEETCQSKSRPSCSVIIVAAGRGERFGGAIAKQFRDLAGRPVLRRTVEAFLPVEGISRIVVVVDPVHRDMTAMALDGLNPAGAVLSIVDGGADRQASVLAGLESLARASDPPTMVLIHDGVRPLVRRPTIEAVIGAVAGELDGAIAAMPVTDTLKAVTDSGIIQQTVDRAGLYRAQTPQGFRFDRILTAHREAAGRRLTDDAAVAEAAGLRVGHVPDRMDNIKITVEEDLALAKVFLREPNMLPTIPHFQGETATAAPIRRFGQGFDVHRTCPGNSVTLCGVVIPAPFGLSGHSDADVALHAVTDAVLGAMADADIGSHFPPTDPHWRGADSVQFLETAIERAALRGYRPEQIDVTIICELPRIGPHRDALRARLAAVAELDAEWVSVKATTSERLGFTGRGEGIAAMAMVVLGRKQT